MENKAGRDLQRSSRPPPRPGTAAAAQAWSQRAARRTTPLPVSPSAYLLPITVIFFNLELLCCSVTHRFWASPQWAWRGGLFPIAAISSILEDIIIQRSELFLASAGDWLNNDYYHWPAIHPFLSTHPLQVSLRDIFSNFKATDCESQSQISRHCLLFTLPAPAPHAAALGSLCAFPFVSRFIFRAKEKKLCRGVILCKEAGFCWVPVPSVCPTRVAGRGLAYQRGQGGVVSWAAGFPRAGSVSGSSPPAHKPTQKSQVFGLL